MGPHLKGDGLAVCVPATAGWRSPVPAGRAAHDLPDSR